MTTLESELSKASPKPIFDLISTLQTAKYLFVAEELNLFDSLGTATLSVDEVASRIGYPPRTTRILLDALVAAEFLTKDQVGYRNAPTASAFLTQQSSLDLRPMLRLWKHLVAPKWSELEAGLRLDKATLSFGELSAEDRQLFSQGVAALTTSTAQRLSATYDFSVHRRVLDLWGGMGDFLRAIRQANPHVTGTLFELPTTAALAREHWANTAPGAITIVEGNVFADPLPTDCDAVLLANIVHLFGPERNQELFKRIRQAVNQGTRLLLVDFWTDISRTQPVFAALMAGEFVVFAGEGDVYSRDQVERWLQDASWQVVTFQPLTDASSLLVAEASSSVDRLVAR